MALSSGTRLGPYQILGPLGAGGMGEVYRAHDTRLDRTVAIKTLPAGLSQDSERSSRFGREAKAIAALTHPHICRLYDVGHHEGIEFLVMELLEGETLSACLERGPLEIAEVLAHAIQIADALDTAHRAHVFHRDLTPANVMLTSSGAKLLDFGLAKLCSEGAPIVDGPTETALTARGQILGTLPYMAPEQLEGKPIDARTDLFAFGAIIYEMATGRRAFDASTQASLIGAILHTSPPPITQVRPGAPPALERLVAICLSKDPEDRWSTAHDVLLQLRQIPEVSEPVLARAGPQSRRLERLAWSAAAAATLTAIALAAVFLVGRSSSPPLAAEVDRLSVLPADQTTLDRGEAPQMSLDGRHVAFVATDRLGRSGLYVRNRDSLVARLLADTEGASMPFWSPNGRMVAFFAQGQLKTVALAGGAPHAIAPAPVPRGGSWNREDIILFSAQPNLPPYRVPAAGGEATRVPVAGQAAGRRFFPSFLPDGRHYLYLDLNARQNTFVVGVASIDSVDTKELVRSTASAVQASGHLLFRRDAVLVAQSFDPRTLQLSGAPIPIAEDVGTNALTYQGLFSASDNAVIAYQGSTAGSQLVWFDRQGKRLSAAAPAADYNAICLTSDDRRIVYAAADPVSGSIDLWAHDVGDARPFRLTFNPAVDFFPVCSPSGQEVAFGSLREGPPNLFRLNFSTPGSDQAVLRSPLPKVATDWSRDGLLVYSVLNQKTNFDIEVVPLSGGPSRVVVATEAEERNARLSPDGRWIAYVSNESGSFEVYVQPFPTTGAKWQVSKGGGQQPLWRRDGRELFYVAPDKKLTGVVVRAGSDFATGEARALIDTRIASWERSSQGVQYAVTADGQRFLVNTATDTTVPITLVLNWTAAHSQ